MEINPSVGSGFRVMTVEEWARRWARARHALHEWRAEDGSCACRWKCNDDFPECLGCGGQRTKEHYFTQTWCRWANRQSLT